MILEYVAVQKKIIAIPDLLNLKGLQNHQSLRFEVLPRKLQTSVTRRWQAQ